MIYEIVNRKIVIEHQDLAHTEDKLRCYRRASRLCSTSDTLPCCSCQKSDDKSRMTNERDYDYGKGKIFVVICDEEIL